jgi:hypothetical protein
MRRNLPNRTLLSNSTEHDVNYVANYCPLPPKTGIQSQNLEPNEHEKLIVRYRELVKEIKTLRGKLYARGIDPEKYT